MRYKTIHVHESTAYAGMFLDEIIHQWIPSAIGVIIGLKLLPYWLDFLEMIIRAVL